MVGTLTVTGDVCAILPQRRQREHHAWADLPLADPVEIPWFLWAEFYCGTIVPTTPASPFQAGTISQARWKYEAGLPRVTAFYANDLIAYFTQTNNSESSRVPRRILVDRWT